MGSSWDLKKVLYIDDDDDIREIAQMCLELDADFAVRVAASGADGIAIARDWLPDIVLVDVMMPEMDGPSTFGQLASDPATRGIKVVFVTARAQPEDTASFLSMGVAGVIAKPFNPMELASVVRGFFIG
jgi:two-component system, OmpR family, response regulator